MIGVARIIVVSFGYLHADPPAAHVVVDVREHLRDPHAVAGLRHLDAASPRVRRAVMTTPGAVALAASVTGAAQALLSGPGGGPVIIAYGCAGGRHRSAVLAGETARMLGKRGIPAAVIHRDIARPVVDRAAAQDPAGEERSA
ncbi:MAG: ATPase [Streptosporangiales bacterium]|nr:ATPase [Streptosporangiales bacterium]